MSRIERFVAAILLAGAVVGAAAFPHLLGRTPVPRTQLGLAGPRRPGIVQAAPLRPAAVRAARGPARRFCRGRHRRTGAQLRRARARQARPRAPASPTGAVRPVAPTPATRRTAGTPAAAPLRRHRAGDAARRRLPRLRPPPLPRASEVDDAGRRGRAAPDRARVPPTPTPAPDAGPGAACAAGQAAPPGIAAPTLPVTSQPRSPRARSCPRRARRRSGQRRAARHGLAAAGDARAGRGNR